MTKEEALNQLHNDPKSFSISEMSEELKSDADVLLSAVKLTFNGVLNLKHASQVLLKDKDFALKVAKLEKYGALEYFSDEIKDDETVVLAFIEPRLLGAEIEFASNRVKGLSNVMTSAVVSNSMALRYALPEQKKDVELVWSAMFDFGGRSWKDASSPIAFLYADPCVRKDAEFFKRVLKKLKDIKAHKDLVKQITESHHKS